MRSKFYRLLSLLIMASALLTACGAENPSGEVVTTGSGTTGGLEAAPAAPPSASDGPLTASSTSPISVELTWTPIEGAAGYTIEVSLAGGERLTLAKLDAGTNRYEDFGVPEGFAQTYHLTADGSDTQYAVTVATPLDANPYTVQPELQSAQATIPGLDLAGLDLANLDPSSLDPSMLQSFDFSSIDENNFDPNAFLQQAGVSDTIGPQGGQLVATGSDGTTYTLTIPAGALAEPTYLLMTPIASLGGYPFSSGTLYGAVQIEPEGLELAVPAMLRIDPASAAGDPGAGLVNVAFGFESDGSDFYLTPFFAGNSGFGQTGTNGKVADQLAVPQNVGILSEIGASQLGPLGAGTATPAEVRTFVKQHTPQRSSRRSAQKAAIVSMDAGQDDLAPLTDPGLRLQQAAAAAGNCSELMKVLEDYSTYAAEGMLNSMSPKGMDTLLKDLALNANAILKAENQKCLHPQNCAIALAGMLSNPASAAQRNLANAYANEFPPSSDSALKNAEEQRKACQLELEIESNLTLSSPDGGDGMLVRVRIPLQWAWDPFGDRAYLTGSGPVTYVDINMNAKKCSFEFSSGGTGRTRFRADELVPHYVYNEQLGDWVLDDFDLRRWSIPGNPNDMIVTCEETQNGQTVRVPRQAQLGGGTCDAWCGHFTASREDSRTIVQWDVTGSGQNPGTVATKTFNRVVPIPVPGATLTERTLFTIRRVR